MMVDLITKDITTILVQSFVNTFTIFNLSELVLTLTAQQITFLFIPYLRRWLVIKRVAVARSLCCKNTCVFIAPWELIYGRRTQFCGVLLIT